MRVCLLSDRIFHASHCHSGLLNRLKLRQLSQMLECWQLVRYHERGTQEQDERMQATTEATATVAGIRFTKVGKLYHFDHGAFSELRAGDYVIVETVRGRQMGPGDGLHGSGRFPQPSSRAHLAPCYLA